MGLKSLEAELHQKNEKYLNEKENMKNIALNAYSKLPLEIPGLESIPKMTIPSNPHPLGQNLFVKVKAPIIEDKLYECSSSDKVEWLRENICKDNNIGLEECTLLYHSRILKDGNILSSYRLRNNSVIRCFINNSIIGGKIEEFKFNDEFLDPDYDFDFTLKHDKNKYYRGGLEYNRPYGWKRYALNVLVKYENDLWIGATGKSNNDSEWAVAYHGTRQEYSESIYKTGLHPGHRNAYGDGIYCTPNINTAALYSSKFIGNDGNYYKLVFQTRVKPSAIIKCTDKDPDAPKDYWYIEDGKDIRCYSICIKRL